MIEPALYEKMCTYAGLDAGDVVLDAGAGFGFLSRFLANKCKEVIAVEKDPHVAEVLREQIKGIGNITVIQGDVLKTELPQFNKVIAIPPYYLSSQLVVWCFERKLDCAVMILQKEFANRLVAPVGSEDYGWLTVFSCLHGEVALLDVVPKEMFYPQPEVDSIIIALKPWRKNHFKLKTRNFFCKCSNGFLLNATKNSEKPLPLFCEVN